MSKSGVYVYRARKPNAVFGLPIIGRHFAYVGETTSLYHRDRQHLLGGGKYDATQKPWSDLKPKRYCISVPPYKWLLRSVETLVILLTWPVYNDQKNRWNPRRVTLSAAARHRAARDAKRFRFHFRWVYVFNLALVGLVMVKR